MADPLIAALRFVHITAAVLWVGAGVLLAMYITPAVGKAGPAGPQFMGTLLRETSFVWWMPLTGTLAVLAGAWLYVASGFAGDPFATRALTVFNVAVSAGILALVVGMVVSFPAVKRMKQLSGEIAAGGGPPSAEQQAQVGALQQRLRLSMQLWSVLVLVALFGMTTYQFV